MDAGSDVTGLEKEFSERGRLGQALRTWNFRVAASRVEHPSLCALDECFVTQIDVLAQRDPRRRHRDASLDERTKQPPRSSALGGEVSQHLRCGKPVRSGGLADGAQE